MEYKSGQYKKEGNYKEISKVQGAFRDIKKLHFYLVGFSAVFVRMEFACEKAILDLEIFSQDVFGSDDLLGRSRHIKSIWLALRSSRVVPLF